MQVATVMHSMQHGGVATYYATPRPNPHFSSVST